ncbi:MAG: HU family DNA-binding protein [Cyclobacteriaceae bacterium]
MSIMYKAIGRGQPGVAGGGDLKYYPTIVRERNVDFRRFIKQIAELNTVNTADVYAVIDSMLQLINRHLSQGRTVELGHFGNFSISLRTEGSETPEEVNRSKIKGTKILFRPSLEFKETLAGISYQKIENPDLAPLPAEAP